MIRGKGSEETRTRKREQGKKCVKNKNILLESIDGSQQSTVNIFKYFGIRHSILFHSYSNRSCPIYFRSISLYSYCVFWFEFWFICVNLVNFLFPLLCAQSVSSNDRLIIIISTIICGEVLFTLLWTHCSV